MTLKLNGTNSEAAPAYAGDDADTGLQCGTNELKLVTGGSARATVDSSGRLLVGTSSARANFYNNASGVETRLQVEGTSFTSSSAAFIRNSNNASDAEIVLAKSRGGSVGSNTVVQSGDSVGAISFQGSDGAEFVEAASITASVDGTPGSNDMPGRIVFSTSSDGASSPTERMRITSSGKVQLTGTRGGSLQPGDNDTLELFTSASNGNANTGCGLTFYNNDGNGAEIGGTIQVAKENGNINNTAGYMRFSTRANNSDPAERMRITSGGHILANTTSVLDLGSGTTSGINLNVNNIIVASRSNGESLSLQRTDSNGNIALFFRSTSSVGGISVTTSATSFNTSSDYRLKENVVDLDGAIDRVKQLAPKRFNFIVDADTTVDGFLAHEAQTVVPEAVTGTHNEVDDDGNAVMQGIDQSKLVPLLTAALQEAIAKIETLETKVAALEAAS